MLFSIHLPLSSVNGFKGCGSVDNGKLLTNQSIDIDQAFMLCGLYWDVLGSTGLYWVVLGCTGLYWAELGCGGL